MVQNSAQFMGQVTLDMTLLIVYLKETGHILTQLSFPNCFGEVNA